MPVKSSFSHVIEPNRFVAPIDPSIYMQGVQYSEQLAKSNLQDISALHNSIFNIPTYGKDKEKLMELDANLKQQLQGMNLSNLGSMESSSQIKNLISSAANNPDVAGIAQRYGSYSQELKKQQDAEAKGQTYVSPLLRQANNYYNSGTYKTDTRFNGSGFVAPDTKDLDEIAKNTPEWENITTKNGYDITQKGKAEGALFNNYYNHFNTNPKWNALLNDQFQQNLEGIDIQTIHNQGIEGIKQLFPHLPPEAQQQALSDVEEGYQLQQTNPYIGNAWKDKLKDDYFKNQAYMAAQAKTYVNTVEKKQNAYSKDAIDFQQAKDLAKYNYDLKHQTNIDNLSPEQKTYVNKLINSGVAKDLIFDENGKIQFDNLPDIPEKKKAQAEANKDLGLKTVNNLVSKMKQGIVGTTDQGTLESLVRNRVEDLGFPTGTTFSNIKFENGKVKFESDAPGVGGKNNGSQEMTVDEFESKLKPVNTTNYKGSEIPAPKTQEEYSKIQKGTSYLDTDGKVKIKQ